MDDLPKQPSDPTPAGQLPADSSLPQSGQASGQVLTADTMLIRANPLTIKLGLIFVLFIILQVPLLMINGVMEERQRFNVDVPLEFKGPGPKQQTIVGPVLTIPYEYETTEEKVTSDKTKDKDDSTSDEAQTVTQKHIGYAHLFPETLNVNGNLQPQLRDEGKFKSILYSTDLQVSGTFNMSDLSAKKIDEKAYKWSDAFLALGISDLRGIRSQTVLNWDGKSYKFVPGTNGLKLFDSGQSVPTVDLSGKTTFPFSFTLALNGSRDLNLFPAGKDNKFSFSSSWTHPTFTGGFLPTEKSVSPQGFRSNWEVSYFSRNVPQAWTDRDPDLKNSLAQYMVGTTLATPVEFYRTSIRAIKYGSLFIVMTFITFLIFELITRLRIHALQYLLVGLALCLFFLMLIAITEWLPFTWAYVIASTATIAQISWYVHAFSKNKSRHLWKLMVAILLALYVYLYVLLQLENFSLLFGAVGLFIALSAILYATRNIDWYGKDEQAT